MGLREFGVMRFVSCVDSFDEMSHRGGNGGKDPMTEARRHSIFRKNLPACLVPSHNSLRSKMGNIVLATDKKTSSLFDI